MLQLVHQFSFFKKTISNGWQTGTWQWTIVNFSQELTVSLFIMEVKYIQLSLIIMIIIIIRSIQIVTSWFVPIAAVLLLRLGIKEEPRSNWNTFCGRYTRMRVIPQKAFCICVYFCFYFCCCIHYLLQWYSKWLLQHTVHTRQHDWTTNK